MQKYMPYPSESESLVIDLLSLETADGIAPRQAVYLAAEVDAELAACANASKSHAVNSPNARQQFWNCANAWGSWNRPSTVTQSSSPLRQSARVCCLRRCGGAWSTAWKTTATGRPAAADHGASMKIHWMSRGKEHVRLWLDIKAFGYWWVLMWYRGYPPYMYRSTDATPPCEDNNGRWIFGRATGRRM